MRRPPDRPLRAVWEWSLKVAYHGDSLMIVDDVEAVDDKVGAVVFYTRHLGFELADQYGQAMVILRLDGLKRWLAGPLAKVSCPMADVTLMGIEGTD